MNDGNLLLRAVLDDPDCNDARLAFADWLQENGEPDRGKFISLSVTQDRKQDDWIESKGDLRHHLVQKARRGNVTRLGQLGDWFYGVPKLVFSAESWESLDEEPAGFVRRGFLELIRCSASDWLQHADTLCLCQPIIGVRLTTVPIFNLEQNRRFTLRHGIERVFFWTEKRPSRPLEGLKIAWPRIEFEFDTQPNEDV